MFIPILGKMFDEYFSIGLKPPTKNSWEQINTHLLTCFPWEGICTHCLFVNLNDFGICYFVGGSWDKSLDMEAKYVDIIAGIQLILYY